MRSLRHVLAVAASTAALGAGALATGPAASATTLQGPTVTAADSGRCAPMTGNSVAGTLVGSDGYALNATIGFDIQDRAGHEIDARTGCPHPSYSAVVQLNHWLGAHGAPVGTPMRSAQGHDEGVADPHFAVLDLPANAYKVFVETYTRRYTGSPCGLPCAGPVDTSKYGLVNRQQLRVGGATSHLQLVADRTHDFGGNTGNIVVHTPTVVGHVYAWSMDISGRRKDEGWGIGVRSARDPHVWTIYALSPNQDYTLIADGYRQVFHVKVLSGRTTRYSVR